MTKAIIFDYGGVLANQPSIQQFSEEYAPRLGKDPRELRTVIHENSVKAKVNEISSKSFWENISTYLGIECEVFRKDFTDGYMFRPEVLDLVKSLKKEYMLGLLSNHIEDWLEEIIREHNLDDVFDVIVASYQSRLEKPGIGIYKEIVEKLGVDANECIYIDDLEQNLPPAQELGMTTILFRDLEQLKRDLSTLGV